MLKILNTEQIKAWDAYTIEHEPIASIDLMERACKAFVQWFIERFDATHRVGVICGSGNNGGDGLGVARLLSEWGYPVKVWIVKANVLESTDFKINHTRLPQKIELAEIKGKPELSLFAECDILIDAIFGSGLSRPVEGIYADVIECINKTDVTRIAIDIPSGLFADKHTTGVSVIPDYTLTFQLPKLSFLLPENEDKVGEWSVVDIGLSKSYRKEADASYFIVEKKDVVNRFPARKKFSHKGELGKSLLVCGGYGKMGACVLASQAALRSGVGLLTVHVPNVGYQIIQTAVPEAMASVDRNDLYFSEVDQVDGFDSIGVGPGIGTNDITVVALRSLMERSPCPMVLDADALNIIAQNRELLHLIPRDCILTPHPGEFRRLAGDWADDFEKLERAKKLAKDTGSVLVLKGAYTAIVSPGGKIYFNNTGNPGMATGGSGDVLTGILTSLLAQKMPTLDAALIGVYVHGLAGDLAAYERGYTALIASDIISFLPQAYKHLDR